MTISLLLGDAYSLVKTIPTASVDLVIIDPPYVVDTIGNGMYKQKDKQYILELAANDMNKGFSFDILDELCRVLKKINIYVFASQKQIMPLLQYFVTQKKCNWNILSWHKTNPIPNCGNKYITDTEFILFFRERGGKNLW